ncbi:MAG: hypothetical protein IJV48_02690 [Ruminococcus sp.]|nr:hypothetical protein [Ruminococcus sp.]
MSYSPKHPSTSGSRAKPRSSADKKTKQILIAVILIVLALIIVAALVFIFVPGAESGVSNLFTGKTEFVPETEGETTIISQYYDDGMLPTSGSRHDVTVIYGGGAAASELEGKWSFDGNTIYMFNGKGRGIMLTAIDNYTFMYSAEGGKLIVDFDIDDAMDSEYTYTLSGEKLIMTRGGVDYEFDKVEV